MRMITRVSRAFKPLTTLMSGRPGAGKLQILIYHRVLAEKDPMMPFEPDVSEFHWQMELLSRFFNVLPLSSALDMLYEDRLPPRAACITFDDGYADNYTLALPVLQKFEICATVFVATGFLGGGIMFNDAVLECAKQHDGAQIDLGPMEIEYAGACVSLDEKLKWANEAIQALKHLPPDRRQRKIDQLAALTNSHLPSNLMMSEEQLISWHNSGMEVGAHTVLHPILQAIDMELATSEIEESRRFLSSLLDTEIDIFAYPNGVPGRDYSDEHVALLRNLGFKAAVSTARGYSNASTNPYELPRFTPWDKTPAKFYVRMLGNYI